MFYLNQRVFELGLKSMPIGTPRVLIGPLMCQAQFPILVQFGLFFRDFLSQELHLDVFLTCILKLIPFILITKSLKQYLFDRYIFQKDLIINNSLVI